MAHACIDKGKTPSTWYVLQKCQSLLKQKGTVINSDVGTLYGIVNFLPLYFEVETLGLDPTSSLLRCRSISPNLSFRL